MLRFFVAILFLALCGCTSTEEADRKFASYASERDAYMKCGYGAARYLTKRNPNLQYSVLTNAARTLCGQERSALVNKITKIYSRQIWFQLFEISDRKFDEAVSLGATY